MWKTFLNRSVLSAVVLAAIAIVGCNRGPDLVPVSGTVLIDGKPLTFGTVRFIPDSGRPALSNIDSQGRFKLMTDEQQGVVAGTHAVEVMAVEPISEYQNRYHAPEQYGSAITSGLTATISEPTDNLEIKLTWGGRRSPN